MGMSSSLEGDVDLLLGIIAWRCGCGPEGEEKPIMAVEYDAASGRPWFQLDPES